MILNAAAGGPWNGRPAGNRLVFIGRNLIAKPSPGASMPVFLDVIE
jgi:hypothetical protein